MPGQKDQDTLPTDKVSLGNLFAQGMSLGASHDVNVVVNHEGFSGS
jgi:hypothetical protein